MVASRKCCPSRSRFSLEMTSAEGLLKWGHQTLLQGKDHRHLTRRRPSFVAPVVVDTASDPSQLQNLSSRREQVRNPLADGIAHHSGSCDWQDLTLEHRPPDRDVLDLRGIDS